MLTKNEFAFIPLPKLLAFLFIFMLFSLPNSIAQKAQGKKFKGVLSQELKLRKEQNRASIQSLKETGIVFYLPTKSKNIQAIQRILDNPNTNTKTHARLVKQQEKIINSTQVRNKALLEAFSKHFDFCPIYISYDTCASKVKQKESGWFVNSSGAFDPSIVMSSETGHWVIISTTPGSTASSQRSLVLKQAKEPQLEYPFPYFAVFRNAFNKKRLRKQGLLTNLEEKPLTVESKTIYVWNSRLKRYYSRSLE